MCKKIILDILAYCVIVIIVNLADQTLDYWINTMRQIAITAHTGQFRNDKKTPYITHILGVADAVEPRLKPIALGHDLLEDTKITLDDLKKAGFPKYILDAIDLLTHRNNEPNITYWKKILNNPDASTVKVADIKYNLNDSPSDRQKQKYQQALQLFANAGYK